MKDILEELNLENGSNYKIKVLTKYKDNKLLKKILELTYDRVKYSFGITKIPEYTPQSGRPISLENALDSLDKLYKREITGNAAREYLASLLSNLSEDNSKILEKVIKRDLRINLGKTQINKVFKDLII